MLVEALAGPGLSWNPAADIRQMWSYAFMVNAFRAGTIVAVTAGVVGWFMVLRRQTFAGHSVAVVGFPGAAGAVYLGISAMYGYFGFCVGSALVIALVSGRGRAGHAHESAVTGTVQSFALACGLLFVALYRGFLNGVNSLLFGSFLGVSNDQVLVLALVAVVTLAVLAVIGRPLLFASVDPDVAAARGVPVRTLSVVFLVLLGAATAEASQITGALLVFALLVMPAATAQLISARPAVSLVLTVVIGLAVTWLGLTVAFYTPYPIGFYITTFAFGAYVVAYAARALAGARLRWTGPPPARPAAHRDAPSGAAAGRAT